MYHFMGYHLVRASVAQRGTPQPPNQVSGNTLGCSGSRRCMIQILGRGLKVEVELVGSKVQGLGVVLILPVGIIAIIILKLAAIAIGRLKSPALCG